MAGISLETDGDSWQGTFTLAVKFIAQDLLSDGAPVYVKVNTVSGTLSGSLTAVEGGHLVIDGRHVDFANDIVGFYVD